MLLRRSEFSDQIRILYILVEIFFLKNCHFLLVNFSRRNQSFSLNKLVSFLFTGIFTQIIFAQEKEEVEDYEEDYLKNPVWSLESGRCGSNRGMEGGLR